ncbi:MAG TPA: glycosyltransferase family 4 protein [Candidatus Saccharimonadales bacterium]|nr:glycosyltransferase family 4 protein [Candidatus Saccharimonadales bacterium]
MASKRLKIGMVLDTSLDPMDGVQQYVVTVGEWLRNQGHDVHYLVGETRTRQLPNIHSLSRNFNVRFNGNRTTIPMPTSRHKLRDFLERQQFDVLHVQIPHSPFMAQRLILAANDKTAVIGTFHVAPYNSLVYWGNWLLGYWLRPSLKRFDQILSVSSVARDFAKDTFKVNSKILPNVIDYPLFHTAKPLAKYDDGKLTLLSLGRLVPRKGCQLLLRAVHILSQDKSLPGFRVVICGKGPLLDKLKTYVSQNGIAQLVEFVGFVDEADKPRYYASADISIFPSSGGECFGIVLLEAMASGKAAVLAGDNPGYRSVMSPQTETLFDPKDANLLAEKLKGYLVDAASRHRLQDWGAKYSAGFDVAVVGRELVSIYGQALHKRRAQ